MKEEWTNDEGVEKEIELIELNDSKRQIKFRVYRRSDGILLFSSDIYSSCEDFCWRYDGIGELEIKKVWVFK